MKKTIAFVLTALMLCLGFAFQSFALSGGQSLAIQDLMDEACRKSGVPGMSMSILSSGEVLYFCSGYADREKGLPADENTLYELASVSKAFTGMGILLLEEQGLLSMTDPVQKYLPWFTSRYRGKPVDMQDLALGDFLHHTSGLTNARHTLNIPQGNAPDLLQKTVQTLVDAELAFAPGERYEYGTVNYDVLGLVMQTVTGQSYEAFMTEQVFKPLGLYNTYVYKEDAAANGKPARGYRSSFFMTTPYDAPEYAGNKPAGYIISCTTDMARWMGIQLGIVKDIPEIFQTIVQKSHQGDMSVSAVNEMYYAAGWSVNADKTIVEHTGGNPNFSTQVSMLTNEQTAICLLTNGANTNIGMVAKVKDILDGNLSQSYEISSVQLLDIAMSSVTIVFCILAIILFILGLRRRKIPERRPVTKRRIIAIALLLIVAIALGVSCVALDWSTILVWQTYSVLTALISSALLSASIAWFAYSR